jgi:hypothetical protein
MEPRRKYDSKSSNSCKAAPEKLDQELVKVEEQLW